ncbi:oxidoreductase [Acrocarpospora catenulata]|uniref:oxidoreductase n=1 Tax=Acrocarpospora catenulata TaxID=2836182 RepID=UPI001BD958E4|nr:FAD-dependent oxidoreductase [Acrocarpospora catenulata]
MSELSPLWEPVRVGAVTLPNRVMVSPHNTAHDDDRLAAYLAARAAGGAGLVVMGGVPVHPSTMTNPMLIPAWEESSIPRLAAIAATVRERSSGGAFFCQIFHAGPNDPGNAVFGYPHAAIAPSAVAAPPSGRIPKVADQADIDMIVEGFATTARNLRVAGFDGVEISACHGYLVHAFLSPTTNQRTDAYGGSPVNRARFALEVGRAIRERCGDDFPVVLRMSLDERLGEEGMTPRSAREVLAVLHASALFDAFSLSGGVYATLDETVAPSSAERDAVFLDSALAAREVVGHDVPLMLTGSVMDLERAAGIVAAGHADVVGMTRAHIADPDLVAKGRSGRLDEVRHCVKGNQGCWRGIKTRTGVTCTVNPRAGREAEWGPPEPAPRPRRVVVVGGGPAGLKAAEVAAERGHLVTLLERGGELGGQLREAALLPGRGSWRHAVDDLVRALARLKVEVRTGVEADPDSVLSLRPDAVVLATGAVWDTDGWSHATPARPGPLISADAVVVGPVEAVARAGGLGRRVVVLDDTGGYVPLGVAELLADQGADVEILSPRPAVGDHTVLTGEATFVVPRVLAKGVRMATRTVVESIDAGGLETRSTVTGAARRVPADAVVMCLHRTPVAELHAALAGRGVEVHRIGDALAPREADDAMVEAVAVGRLL